MELDKLKSENDSLKLEVIKLNNEIEELKEHLKKYTAPTRAKKYYQNHKTELAEKNKEYKKKRNYKVDPEKRKEYNKKYYENKKKNISETPII